MVEVTALPIEPQPCHICYSPIIYQFQFIDIILEILKLFLLLKCRLCETSLWEMSLCEMSLREMSLCEMSLWELTYYRYFTM